MIGWTGWSRGAFTRPSDTKGTNDGRRSRCHIGGGPKWPSGGPFVAASAATGDLHCLRSTVPAAQTPETGPSPLRPAVRGKTRTGGRRETRERGLVGQDLTAPPFNQCLRTTSCALHLRPSSRPNLLVAVATTVVMDGLQSGGAVGANSSSDFVSPPSPSPGRAAIPQSEENRLTVRPRSRCASCTSVSPEKN